MKKISQDSLNLDIYQHFSKYYDCRGVGIISNIQFIFYTQTSLDDNFDHNTALTVLDNMIYPDKSYNTKYKKCDDITITTNYETIIITLPKSGVLTEKQYNMLKYFLFETQLVTNDFSENTFKILIASSFDNSGCCSSIPKDLLIYLDKYYLESLKRDVTYNNCYKEQPIGRSYN